MQDAIKFFGAKMLNKNVKVKKTLFSSFYNISR